VLWSSGCGCRDPVVRIHWYGGVKGWTYRVLHEGFVFGKKCVVLRILVWCIFSCTTLSVWQYGGGVRQLNFDKKTVLWFNLGAWESVRLSVLGVSRVFVVS